MKRSITGMIAVQAFSCVREAKSANQEKDHDREVSDCVVGQLLMGLTLEGVANELADRLFPAWPKERLDKADTAFKWWFLSAHNNRVPFEQSAEPLQIVTQLMKARNKIAHPRVHDLGDENILQDMSGNIQRNVPGTQELRPGDRHLTATVGFMEKHDYNFAATLSLLRRTIAAVIILRDHVETNDFVWADQLRIGIVHQFDQP
jgi:hypothetical protein